MKHSNFSLLPENIRHQDPKPSHLTSPYLLILVHFFPRAIIFLQARAYACVCDGKTEHNMKGGVPPCNQYKIQSSISDSSLATPHYTADSGELFQRPGSSHIQCYKLKNW